MTNLREVEHLGLGEGGWTEPGNQRPTPIQIASYYQPELIWTRMAECAAGEMVDTLDRAHG
jgi:hypothetical protein